MNGKKVAIGAAIFAAWITVTEVVGHIRYKRGLKIGYESEYDAEDIERFKGLEKEERKIRKMETK